MAGIELIISSICNATFCEIPYNEAPKAAETDSNKDATNRMNYMALMKDINGKNIKVATYNNTPLSWTEYQNGKLVGKGIAFKVMKILSKRFNFTYDIVEPIKNIELGGTRPEESVIGLVNSSKVDMAAAFLANIPTYREKVSFSIDLDEGIWVMMLKRPKASATGTGILAPFDDLVWYLVLAAVLTFGPCITFFTRLRTRLVPDDEGVLPLRPSFWFVYSASLKQGTNLAPEANSTRVLFVTWWIFMTILSSFYTANLTAFLTLSKFTLPIEDARDLYRKNYSWVASAGGSVQHVRKSDTYLKRINEMKSSGRAQFLSVKNDKDFLEAVNGGSVLIKELNLVDRLMYNDYISKKVVAESEKCTYVIVPNAFMKLNRAFAFPIDSPLKKLFDPVLSLIFQSGIIDYLKRAGLPDTKICPIDLQSKDRKLSNSDLIMTYLVFTAGLATAAAVFAAELLIQLYLTIKIGRGGNTGGKRKKSTSEIRDESQPPPYESLFNKNTKFNVSDMPTKMINGREYYVFETSNGGKRLVPARAPSSYLYRTDQ